MHAFTCCTCTGQIAAAAAVEGRIGRILNVPSSAQPASGPNPVYPPWSALPRAPASTLLAAPQDERPWPHSRTRANPGPSQARPPRSAPPAARCASPPACTCTVVPSTGERGVLRRGQSSRGRQQQHQQQPNKPYRPQKLHGPRQPRTEQPEQQRPASPLDAEEERAEREQAHTLLQSRKGGSTAEPEVGR